MIESQLFLDKDIIDLLQTNYNIKVNKLTFMPLGADIDAAVYKAETDNQFSYFIKIKQGNHHNIGAIIQKQLHDAGISHIICPITTKHGQISCTINNLTLIVYPFIQGQDGFSQHLTDNQWITFGQNLRKIHEFQLPAYIKEQINHESYSSKWRKIIRSIYTHIQTEPQPFDQAGLKLLIFMKQHKNTIEHLVDRAEQLGKKIKKAPHNFVLCHADMHAGNLLLADDGTAYIVDWDQPIMAHKERDLMFIGGGVANVWNDPAEEKLFYQGYGNIKINLEIIAYYRHERIIEDLALYSQQLILTNNGGKEREIIYKHVTDMFQTRGVVDIALTTDVD